MASSSQRRPSPNCERVNQNASRPLLSSLNARASPRARNRSRAWRRLSSSGATRPNQESIAGKGSVEVEVGDEAAEERGVPVARVVFLAGFAQALQPERADRLQHGEARGERVGVGATHHQALVDQGVEAGERLRERQAADGRRGLQRPAPGEDGEAAEERLLLRREQVVGPGDRVLDRLVPGRGIARSRAQHPQALAEQRQQRGRRQHVRPCRRQLDGQGQPVQPPADLRHGPGVLLGEGEVGIDGPGPLHEEGRGRRRAHGVEGGVRSAAPPGAVRAGPARRARGARRGWWPAPGGRDSRASSAETRSPTAASRCSQLSRRRSSCAGRRWATMASATG